MSSIFTKIIKGEIPSYKIAENSANIAFLDVNPIAKGHTLVVPKKEIDYLFDLSDDTLKETIIFAKKVATAIDSALSPMRTGLIVEGLEVPHAHIHLVPIYKESQTFSLGHSIHIPESEMKQISELITKEVRI